MTQTPTATSSGLNVWQITAKRNIVIKPESVFLDKFVLILEAESVFVSNISL